MSNMMKTILRQLSLSSSSAAAHPTTTIERQASSVVGMSCRGVIASTTSLGTSQRKRVQQQPQPVASLVRNRTVRDLKRPFRTDCTQITFATRLVEGRVHQFSSESETKSNSGKRNISSRSKKYFSTASIGSSREKKEHDRLIVVGSGVAGSATALIAAECYKVPVTVLFAGQVPTDCNSYWAQGGIIYRNYDPASGDSAESLSADIHRAGAGLCQDDAVWKVANEGPERVRQLLLSTMSGSKFANVPFDIDPLTQKLALCLEASHAAPRILHKADHTRAVITQHITAAAAKHPLITFQGNTIVTDLVTMDDTCVGVQTMDRLNGTNQPNMYASRGVVLATGGLAGIYEHSTNPAGFNALGSSVALATRANVRTRDLEYVQFHPTALCIKNEPRFLLTEALRGEGAILRDSNGRQFCYDYHESGELAPRDIVARAVYTESQKKPNKHNVFLDITHRDAKWLHQRFPTIQTYLKQRNMDLAIDQLPITPAAHYTCGGIQTDLYGRTSLRGLYAAGEGARTGLHGGNRLASTSLLEGLVFGASVADFVGNTDEGKAIGSESFNRICDNEKYNMYFTMNSNSNKTTATRKSHNANATSSSSSSSLYEPYQLENASYRAMHMLTLLRKIMWDNVGVIRTHNGLNVAIDVLQQISYTIEQIHHTCPTIETVAVRDAATAGLAVAYAARANPNSIGAHCIIPNDDDDNNNVTVGDSNSNTDNKEDDVDYYYDEIQEYAQMR